MHDVTVAVEFEPRGAGRPAGYILLKRVEHGDDFTVVSIQANDDLVMPVRGLDQFGMEARQRRDDLPRRLGTRGMDHDAFHRSGASYEVAVLARSNPARPVVCAAWVFRKHLLTVDGAGG